MQTIIILSLSSYSVIPNSRTTVAFFSMEASITTLLHCHYHRALLCCRRWYGGGGGGVGRIILMKNLKLKRKSNTDIYSWNRSVQVGVGLKTRASLRNTKFFGKELEFFRSARMKNIFIPFLPFLNTIVLVSSHGTMTDPVPRQPESMVSISPDFLLNSSLCMVSWI